MLVTVSRWGNSLAIRVPRGIAEDAGIVEGAAVDIRVEDGKIVAEPLSRPTLDALLAAITPENLHSAQLDDPAIGGEVW